MSQFFYTSLLGNVNKSIMKLSLGDGFILEEWPTEDFVHFYQEMHCSEESEIWFKIDNEWGYGLGRKTRPKSVYTINKKLDDYPIHPSTRPQAEWDHHFNEYFNYHRKYEKTLEDKITKIRLLCDGSIKICSEFFWEMENEERLLDSSTEETLHGENRICHISSKDVPQINSFLSSPALNNRHKYLIFALDNYLQSYRVAHTDLEFITLMISLECLFNDGKQELRNKIARGCAVLLGKTKAASHKVYKDIRNLYDKRSILVHTGDKSSITDSDVYTAKRYARMSLLKLFELNISKENLSQLLVETGFGSASRLKITNNRTKHW